MKYQTTFEALPIHAVPCIEDCGQLIRYWIGRRHERGDWPPHRRCYLCAEAKWVRELSYRRRLH